MLGKLSSNWVTLQQKTNFSSPVPISEKRPAFSQRNGEKHRFVQTFICSSEVAEVTKEFGSHFRHEFALGKSVLPAVASRILLNKTLIKQGLLKCSLTLSRRLDWISSQGPFQPELFYVYKKSCQCSGA